MLKYLLAILRLARLAAWVAAGKLRTPAPREAANLGIYDAARDSPAKPKAGPRRKTDCPRAEGHPAFSQYLTDTPGRPDDGTCDFCGSLSGNAFMARLEAGDVELRPTDKGYKAYLHNQGGPPFKQSYRTDWGKGGADPSKWTWGCRETDEAKFYFQHLSAAQKGRFVTLLNEGRVRIGPPGYLYVLPYFCVEMPRAGLDENSEKKP